MRLLDRYLLRELLIPLGYCLSGILIFWISADIVSEMDEFQENGLDTIQVVEYYLLKFPELLAIVLPIALLLALLYAVTNHARNQELTAIRGAGISLWRLSLPYFSVGLAFSLLLFGINEFWLPGSAELAEQLLEGGGSKAGNDGGRKGIYYENVNFRNRRDDRFWNIEAYDPIRHELIKPDIEWRLPDGSERHWFAERGVWTNGAWKLFDVEGFYYPSDPEALLRQVKTNELVLSHLPETPNYIELEIKMNQIDTLRDKRKVHVSIQEILKYQHLNPDMGESVRRLLSTKLQMGLAAPLTCFVVVLIALPFGVGTSRRNAFVGVASSIFICIAYILLQRLAFSLGIGAYLPPWLAAWLPNVLFSAIGLGLLFRAK